MGQGSNFPCVSSCAGRPAIVGASTTEVTGNGFCCAASMVPQRITTRVRSEFLIEDMEEVEFSIVDHGNADHKMKGGIPPPQCLKIGSVGKSQPRILLTQLED